MDYKRIYNELCQRGLLERNINGYCEKHHIIPKCMGGTNDKSNIAVLTYREHYLAHYLLTKIYKEQSGVNYAFLCMLRKQPTGERVLTSRMFENIKSNFSNFKKKYCKLENPGKTKKSREAARKRMIEKNPIKMDPSKNRTAQPIKIYFDDGRIEKYSYAKEYCIKNDVPYATIKPLLRKENNRCKKYGILKIERIVK